MTDVEAVMMAARKEALEALLAKIEADTPEYDDHVRAFGGGGGFYGVSAHYQLSHSAYFNGSLDAAKRLHEAVLPEWATWNAGHSVFGYEFSLMKGNLFAKGCSKEEPARAWLIAIIKALIQEEGGA